MALYYFDGFDNYYGSAFSMTNPALNNLDIVNNTGKMQWSLFTSGQAPPTGRNGVGKCVNVFSATSTFSSGFNEAFVGFAITAPGMASTYNIAIGDAGTNQTHCSMTIDPVNNIITIYDKTGAAVGTTPPNSINMYLWNFLEIHVKIADSSSGIFELQVNGELVYSNTTMNTQEGSATTFDRIVWTTSASLTDGVLQYGWLIDDFRINDTTTGAGSFPCNSWMGDLRCVTLYPAGNHSVTWTPASGTNWSEVNNPGTASLGTTYNSTVTSGAIDLFLMQALPNVINYIVGVQVKGAYQQNDSASHTATNTLSISGTTYTGTTWTLTNSYQFLTDLWAINPNTGLSWTYSDIINMFAGYKNIS